jgi:hypothetical protein
MIHDRLKEVYDEFDRHCRFENIDYSIDADYHDVQGYRLLDGSKVVGVLRHMSNFVKDRWVDLEYNGFPIDYNDLKSSDFNVSTYNPLFKFTLKSIQEDEMDNLHEDSLKGPSNAHGRRQAAFPSSFRKLKTRDTYEGGGKKKKKKEKAENESLDRSISFEERLDESINENVGLSIVEPDILLTKNEAPSEEESNFEEELELESKNLTKLMGILESTEDEYSAAIIESLIENSSDRISLLNKIIRGPDGTN